MAGIGFELRRTLEGRTFTAYVRAYVAALAYASGPWICTILALGGIVALGKSFLPVTVVEQFTVVTVYVYAFSLLLTGPLQLVTTRFVADRIYEKRHEAVPGGVLTSVGLTAALALVVGTLFAFFARLPWSLKASAVLLYVVVCSIWMIMSYVSCLKAYRLVTVAFGAGMALSWALALGLARVTPFPLLGLVWGYTAGHVLVFAVLALASVREMRGPWALSREFLGYLPRYPALLMAGLLANLAIWVDKFVIWGLHGEAVWGIFLFYPPYDIPAYLAYLTAIPSTAFFLIKVETLFAERYERFTASLLDSPASVVTARREEMVRGLRDGLSQLLSFQGVITLVCLLAAPQILERLGLADCPTVLFRTLLVAAYCHFGFLHAVIFLMYFDRRGLLVGLFGLFVLVSGGATFLAAGSGRLELFAVGYAAAALTSLSAAVGALLWTAGRIDGLILFHQPLLGAGGRVMSVVDRTDEEHGGRVLLRRVRAAAPSDERSPG